MPSYSLRSSFLSLACACGLATLVAGPGYAETRVESAGIVDEIMVTSRYRTESMMDVPDSITAFTPDEIERYRIERINRVASLTPNLRFSDDQEVGVSTLVIRGVRQNRGTGQPPVSFRVDGVNATNNLLTTQELFDVERVEVVRGPQGALYGRNAIGGAILITNNAPTPVPEYRARFSAAQGEDFILAASASGPVTDTLMYRAAVRLQDREGQLKNAYLDDQYVDFKESAAGRARLLFVPTERLSVDLRGEYTNQEGGSGYFMPASEGVLPLPPPDPPIFFGNPVYEIQSNVIGESFVESWEGSAKFDYDMGFGTLTSITSYTDVDSGNDQDLDQTLVDAINIVVIDESQTFAQELRLASNGDEKFDWMAGLYFFDQDRFRSLATTFLGTPVPPAAQDLKLRNYAAFGNLDVELVKDLELTLAFRYDVEKPEDTTQGRSETFSELQPKASLAYYFNENSLGYVTIGKGFRAGGFNNLAPGSNFEAGFDSETLISYEAGFKNTAAGGKVRTSLSLFFIDYTDQQYFLFDQTGTQANINVPQSEILGGELEITATPIESLDVNFGLALTDSEIKEYNEVPGVLVPAEDIIGSKVPGAPVWTLNLGLQQSWALPRSLDLIGRVDWEHRGKTYWTLDNVDTQAAYDLVNLSLGLEEEHWEARLFVNNLFDEEYIEWFFAARFIGLPADIAWPSKPRQVGMELSLRF